MAVYEIRTITEKGAIFIALEDLIKALRKDAVSPVSLIKKLEVGLKELEKTKRKRT